MAKKTKRKKKDMSLDDFFRMRLEAAFVSSAKPKPNTKPVNHSKQQLRMLLLLPLKQVKMVH